MFLVGVHAQVSAAAAPLLERTLNALVEDVAEEALRCFRQVKRFGMGGMLRVRHAASQFPRRVLIKCEKGYARDRVHASDALAIRDGLGGENPRRPVQQDIPSVCA